MPGIEPGASRMRSGRSTTELHPQHILPRVCVYCFISNDIPTVDEAADQRYHWNRSFLRSAKFEEPEDFDLQYK